MIELVTGERYRGDEVIQGHIALYEGRPVGFGATPTEALGDVSERIRKAVDTGKVAQWAEWAGRQVGTPPNVYARQVLTANVATILQRMQAIAG